MAKYYVFIDCVTTKTYEIEAESPDKACEIAEQIIQEPDFFDEYRKDCEIMEPSVCDEVIDEHDRFVDRYSEEE